MFWIEKNRYGWILRISATEQWRVELTRAGISASALDNIAALNGAGFDWIWFDRDAEQVPETDRLGVVNRLKICLEKGHFFLACNGSLDV
ncbi:hypothetical protein [Klebsiella pneumoniae]|uniref:DUF5983 family protein n=1 Tax=Klebsiella pneumoniae TaxID=573 RepID=UPI001D195990|nr:hypothetical protein [Klebsiella pneumoniae]